MNLLYPDGFKDRADQMQQLQHIKGLGGKHRCQHMD